MSKEIDNKIMALQYTPEEVLVFQGEPIKNFKKAEIQNTDGKYIVITREKVSMKNNNVDIGIIDSIADLTFPGALLLANSNLVDNRPNPITVLRKPIELHIDLPGLEEKSIFVIPTPNYASVKAAIDGKLGLWNKDLSDKNSIVARSQYTESMVYNESQLAATFGLGIKTIKDSLNIDFTAVHESKSSVFIAAFNQIFYAVSMTPPNHPSDLLDEEVTWADLQRYDVNDQNPPAFVSHVAYGRTIYVKLESDFTNSDVEAAFRLEMKNGTASTDVKYKDIIANTTFTAIVLGGGIDQQNEIFNVKDISAIRSIITKYSNCSAQNPGYPISYTTCFLKNNQLAAINNNTEYIKTTSTEYANAKIVLEHTGGYVAQFKVEWKEVTYDDNGDKKFELKKWERNLTNLTASFSTEIALPGNSEELCVYAKECTGLAWEWWRTVFDRKNIPLVPSRTFHIYGTTLNQKYTITPSC